MLLNPDIPVLLIAGCEAGGGKRNALHLFVLHFICNTFLSAPELLTPLNDFH